MRKFIRMFVADSKATAAIEAAFIFPVLGAVTFGMLEMILLIGEMHFANEASREAAREAIIMPLLTKMDTSGDYVVDCVGDAGTAASPTYTCSGQVASDAPALTDDDYDDFTFIFNEAAGIKKDLDPSQLTITYRSNDVVIAQANVVTPSVTVTISPLVHNLVLLKVFPGAPPFITLPDASATRMAATYVQ